MDTEDIALNLITGEVERYKLKQYSGEDPHAVLHATLSDGATQSNLSHPEKLEYYQMTEGALVEVNLPRDSKNISAQSFHSIRNTNSGAEDKDTTAETVKPTAPGKG